MEIRYTRRGNFLLPDIVAGEPPNTPPLGGYGMRHKAYLREHRPILYNKLLLSGQIYPLCREIDEAAAGRLDAIKDPEIAHEIILAELVYPDHTT